MKKSKKIILRRFKLKSIVMLILSLAAIATGVFMLNKSLDIRNKAAGSGIALILNPGELSAEEGKTYPIDIIMNTNGDTACATDVSLSYDPTLIEIVSFAAKNVFPVILIPEKHDQGTLSVTLGSRPNSPFKGTGVIGTLMIKTKTNNTASINFNNETQVASLENEANALVSSVGTNIYRKIIVTDQFNANQLNPSLWTVSKSEGSDVSENLTDGLIFSINSGASNEKYRRSLITSTVIVPKENDFSTSLELVKPQVTGEGTGATAFTFTSTQNSDKESLSLRWLVQNDPTKEVSNKLLYVISSSDGTIVKRSEVTIPSTAKITFGFNRKDNKYTIMYKVGPDDENTPWIQLGNATNTDFGSDGILSVITSNTGLNDKFPQVTGKVEKFSLTYHE